MEHSTLHILWLNDNPSTAEHMVFMYATNALLQGWWENVHLIVWGATTKLLCESADMQRLVQRFLDEGGQVSACKRCAENLNVLDKLKTIKGIKVYYIGERFSEIIKGTEKLITL
ncbi:MAG: DsrE family protein [Desulfobulbus sp.]|nr:DsrE family protein [Desulfobulbus sp.]